MLSKPASTIDRANGVASAAMKAKSSPGDAATSSSSTWIIACADTMDCERSRVDDKEVEDVLVVVLVDVPDAVFVNAMALLVKVASRSHSR